MDSKEIHEGNKTFGIKPDQLDVEQFVDIIHIADTACYDRFEKDKNCYDITEEEDYF